MSEKPTLLVLIDDTNKAVALRILTEPTDEKVARAHTAMIKQARTRYAEHRQWSPRQVRERTRLVAYSLEPDKRGWPVIDWRWPV